MDLVHNTNASANNLATAHSMQPCQGLTDLDSLLSVGSSFLSVGPPECSSSSGETREYIDRTNESNNTSDNIIVPAFLGDDRHGI